jgi:hypothetical protein
VRDQVAQQSEAGARENGLPEVPGAGWEGCDSDCVPVSGKPGVFSGNASNGVRSVEAAF